MKIRGKKLNATQRKVLINNGVDNLDNYLYVQTEVTSGIRGKHLDQHSHKFQSIVVVNRATGVLEKYPMEV